MSQGYGFEQQPQHEAWGQQSPPAAPTPGGYPGAAGHSYPGAAGHSFGAPQRPGGASQLTNLAKWLFYGVIAVVAVRVVVGVLGFAVGFFSGAVGASGSMDGALAVAGVGGVLALLGLLVNGLISLVVLVLAIVIIVQASGRGRTGAIIIVAALVLAVIVYWIIQIIYRISLGGITDPGTAGVVSIVSLIAEIARSLVVFAALITGAIMVRRWVAQNA